MVQMFLSWTEVPLVPGVRLLSLSLGFCMILLRSNKSKTMVLYPNSFLPKQIRLRFWHRSDSPRMIAINFHRHLFTIEDHRNTWRYMETHTVETHTHIYESIWKHHETPQPRAEASSGSQSNPDGLNSSLAEDLPRWIVLLLSFANTCLFFQGNRRIIKISRLAFPCLKASALRIQYCIFSWEFLLSFSTLYRSGIVQSIVAAQSGARVDSEG